MSSETGRGEREEILRKSSIILGIANSSLYELQTQLLISNKLNLLNKEILEGLLTQIEDCKK